MTEMEILCLTCYLFYFRFNSIQGETIFFSLFYNVVYSYFHPIMILIMQNINEMETISLDDIPLFEEWRITKELILMMIWFLQWACVLIVGMCFDNANCVKKIYRQ